MDLLNRTRRRCAASAALTTALLAAAASAAPPGTEPPGELPAAAKRIAPHLSEAEVIDFSSGEPHRTTIYFHVSHGFTQGEPVVIFNWVWPGRPEEDSDVDATAVAAETFALRWRRGPQSPDVWTLSDWREDEYRQTIVRVEGGDKTDVSRLEDHQEFFHTATLPFLLASIDWRRGDAHTIPIVIENSPPRIREMSLRREGTEQFRDPQGNVHRVHRVRASFGEWYNALYMVSDEPPYLLSAQYTSGPDGPLVQRIDFNRLLWVEDPEERG